MVNKVLFTKGNHDIGKIGRFMQIRKLAILGVFCKIWFHFLPRTETRIRKLAILVFVDFYCVLLIQLKNRSRNFWERRNVFDFRPENYFEQTSAIF